MICVTTYSIEGQEILSYKGIVAAEVIHGANLLKDVAAQMHDVLGGRVETYEKIFDQARRQAMDAIEKKSRALGANGIVGVKFTHQTLGAQNGMVLVVATGTAVVLRKNAAARRADEAAERDDEALHYVHLKGSRHGPLSKNQIRELHKAGSVTSTTQIENEAADELISVEHLLART